MDHDLGQRALGLTGDGFLTGGVGPLALSLAFGDWLAPAGKRRRPLRLP